jgi:non-specific serine/threonine protein kinase
MAEAAHPDRITHYRILHKLGEGGMGVVYVAEDERLGRRVALKLIRPDPAEPNAGARLIREARVAASVSHPSICQVFDLGEWERQPFLVMELVEGETLASRLTRGPLPTLDALRVAVAVAEALSALHSHGIAHRDLKPSNIILTAGSHSPTRSTASSPVAATPPAQGPSAPASSVLSPSRVASEIAVKVLDFGLARPLYASGDRTMSLVTQSGLIVGTPQYAAPEQLSGGDFDVRADLFSLGVILFEMLAGRPPFTGATLPALVHAVMYDAPPVLTGSAAIAAVDRVVHRALAKLPDERYQTAGELAGDLREVMGLVDTDRVAEARPMTRLAVLPFRLLKPDPDIDYLGLSLADAIVSSLSGFESLVVRSTLKSARYAGVSDLNLIASELAVDMVLTGSLLRSGDRLRVGAELVSVPAGDTFWAQTTQVASDAIFDLHDELAQRVVTSLPLLARDRERKPNIGSASPKGFDLYLRGMQLRMESSSWHQARSLFDQCLALDPMFAPAWAERGRLDRVLGKYEDPALQSRAESALQRALALDPDNGAAHHYYAQLEIDLGRVEAAMTRLLDRVRQRRAEPQVYAALVQACRYAGLLNESVAAHRQACRLDPTVSTSVLHTYYMLGDYARALDEGHRSSDPFEARVLGALGREAEAIEAARREEARFTTLLLIRSFCTGLRAAFEGNREEALVALESFDSVGLNDGEALFYVAEVYAKLGLADRALGKLLRAVDQGFVCTAAFENDPYLAPVRETSEWPTMLERVRSEHERLFESFTRAGGPALLGTSR